jgi:hypothetical protein
MALTGIARYPRPTGLRPSAALAAAAAAALLALALTAALAAVSVVRLLTGGDGAGGDFASIYAAGRMIVSGDGALLYHAAAQESLQQSLYPGHLAHYNPYVLPAFVAWLMAPLAKMDFGVAFAVWAAINLALLVVAVRALAAWLAPVPAMPRRALLAVFVCSMPVVANALFGQVDLFVFAGVLFGWLLLERDRPVAAGFALSLALCKPHLLAGIVLLLLVQRRWRPLLVLAAVALPLLVLPALLLGPGVLLDNVAALISFPGSNAADAVNAGVMPNWRGFVVSLSGRNDAWLWLPGAALIAAAAMALALRRWLADGAARLAPQSYALAVLLPLLVSPHLHTQSLMLLFVPVALALRARFEHGGDADAQARATMLLLALHAALFALWLSAALGLAPMIFLVAAIFVSAACRWPTTANSKQQTAKPPATSHQPPATSDQ